MNIYEMQEPADRYRLRLKSGMDWDNANRHGVA